MEPISKILDAIADEAKAEADKIIESGKKNAEETFRLYEKEARIDEDSIFEKVAKELGEEVD